MIWKDILGWEGLYQVSEYGDIKSLDRYVISKNGRRRFFPGRLRIPEENKEGYLRIRLWNQSNSIKLSVHTLVALAFINSVPDENLEVRHLDGNNQNNHYSNLAWGTKQENAEDSIRHKTHFQKNKTHCPNNHLLHKDNIVVGELNRKSRACLACNRARNFFTRQGCT